MTTPAEHRVSIVVGQRRIDGWLSYDILSSMVNPADTFELTRPFDAEAYRLCDTDQPVSILIDDVTVIVGRIDKRHKASRDGTMSVSGRDKGGRLVQESIPDLTGIDSMKLATAAAKIVAPWFDRVVLDDARNRSIRLGRHGAKAAAAGEPVVLDVKKKTGQLDPGMMRWNCLEELISRSGYCCWSSADGRELIIGAPNYRQAPQWLIRQARPGSSSPSTCKDLQFEDDVGDRYSKITVTGAGAGDDVDFGESTMYRGEATNGPGPDGIGIDFDAPKRLRMAEHSLLSNAEAKAIADREMARRDFHGHTATAQMPHHGQVIGNGRVIFAPNTIARVIDEEQDPEVDQLMLVYEVRYQSTRDGGEVTDLMLVPKGTKMVL